MIEVTSAVESDGGDPFLKCALCNCLSDDCSGLDAGLALAFDCKELVVGCGCGKGIKFVGEQLRRKAGKSASAK